MPTGRKPRRVRADLLFVLIDLALLCLLVVCALALLVFVSVVRAWGREGDCDIALALSFDASVSMEEPDWRFMREGTAAALLDPSVVKSFSTGTVFVQVTEWADDQEVLMDWTPIGGRPDLERLAALLTSAPRSDVGSSTGLGSAMLFAAAQFARGPACDRLVLDIAGDGENNTGPHPRDARLTLDPAIQVNALATTQTAARFYRNFVIQGPGAFVEQTDGYERIGEAMKAKLNKELFMSSL